MSLNVPNSTDIVYGSGHAPGTTYGPYTEKSVLFGMFLALANQNPTLVSVEVVGTGYPKSGSGTGWDEVIFKVGNPNGGRVLWDSYIHGLEDFGVEPLYAIYKWLLTPNANTNQEARRLRILSKNCVGFFPFVNWRWSRSTYHTAPCSGYNDDDGRPIGYNIARNFRNNNESTCSTNNYGGTPLSEPETQAMMTAWDLWNDHPNGWFYVNLHMGTSSRSGGGSRAPEVETLRRNTIYAELFGGTPSLTIGTNTGVPGFAPGDAVEYYGASAGFLLELGGSDWKRTATAYASLTSGDIYKMLLSLLVAQCQLVESDIPPPPDTEVTLEVSIAAGSGTTSPTAGIYTYDPTLNTVITLTATPAANSVFSKWEIDGVFYYDASRSVTMNANHTAKAYFYRPALYLSVGASGGGATLPFALGDTSTGPWTAVPAGEYVRDKGTVVWVLAYPNASSRFVKWTATDPRTGGTVEYTDNPVGIALNDALQLVVTFESLLSSTLTIASDPTGVPYEFDGVLSPNVTNYAETVATGSSHSVTIRRYVQIGGTWYEFVRWDDNSTPLTRSNILVDVDKTVTAYYRVTINPPLGNVETVGINYLSRGNHYYDVNVASTAIDPATGTNYKNVVDEDFARFQRDGIHFISLRIVWKAVEPTSQGVFVDEPLINTAAVLDLAKTRGLTCNIDFWTHFQDPSSQTQSNWVPAYLITRNGSATSAAIFQIIRDAQSKNDWFNFVSYCMNYLKGKTNISGWTVLNEPFYGYAGALPTDKGDFQTFFQDAYNRMKNLDPKRVIGCRFTLSFSAGGTSRPDLFPTYTQKFDDSTIGIFDIYGVNVYLDATKRGDPTHTKYNADWTMWDNLYPKIAIVGKTAWIYEFGQNSTDQEVNRAYYENTIAYYNGGPPGQGTMTPGFPTRIWAWAFQHRCLDSNGNQLEPYNLYSGYDVHPAYYELLKYSRLVTRTLNILPPTGNGYTTPPAGSHEYDDLFTVDISAFNDSSWKFDHWLLDGHEIGNQNPLSLLMLSDHDIQAVFTGGPPVDVSISGTVVDSKTRLPLQDVSVTFNSQYGTETNPDGQYAMMVPKGLYEVTFTKNGYITKVVSGVDASTNSVVLNVSLDPEGTPPKPPFPWWILFLIPLGVAFYEMAK